MSGQSSGEFTLWNGWNYVFETNIQVGILFTLSSLELVFTLIVTLDVEFLTADR